MKPIPVALLLLLLAGDVLAAQTCPPNGPSICSIAKNINAELDAVGKLIEGIAYVSGFVLGIVALFKFKAHRDNPHQMTLSVPISYLGVAICLLALPMIFGGGITTVFGEGMQASGLVRPPPEKQYIR